MNFLIKNGAYHIHLVCLSCFIFLSTILHTRELEIYLGAEMIAARNALSVSSSPSSTIEISQMKQMRRHLDSLEESFKKAGGYDLLGKASYLRWAWLSSTDKTWIMQVPFTQNDLKSVENSIMRAGGEKTVTGVYKNKDLLLAIKNGKVLVGYKVDEIKFLKETGYWSIPACEWFQVRAFKPLFEELARRQQRLDALLSYITEINLSWLSGDLLIDIQLTDSEKATALVVSANAGISLVKNLILAQDSYNSEDWHILDFISFSQQSVNSKSIEQMFERLRFQSYGKVFQIEYAGVGPLDKFLTRELPKRVFDIFLAIMPNYTQHRNNLAKLITSGSGKSAQNRLEEANSGETCQSEIKMIQQAVEFYNLDHLRQGKYHQIKSKLFVDGYLPENLACDGKLIRDFKLFEEKPDGSLQRRR